MESSIIKVVTHTQFETCVTTFIALDFKLRREKFLDEFEIISLFEGYFLMTVTNPIENSTCGIFLTGTGLVGLAGRHVAGLSLTEPVQLVISA